MAFNLSGTTITQTLTDTDLSGLASIAGVTTQVVGTGNNEVTYYFLGNLLLTISGNLQHDPEEEVIVFDDTGRLLITSGAMYDYGREIVAPDTTSTSTLPAPTGDRFSTACGLIIPNDYGSNLIGAGPAREGGSIATSPHPLRINNGGEMIWRGGEIRLGGTWFCQTGAVLTISGGTLYKTGSDAIRWNNAPTITVDGFTKIGGILYLSGGQPIQFDGYNPIHSVAVQDGIRNPYAILVDGDGAGGGAAAISTPVTITDLSGTGNKVDVAVLDRPYIILQNPQDGINVATDTWLGGNGNRNEGRVETYKRNNFNVTDLSTGNAISGANFRYTDINNGSRVNEVGGTLTPSTTLTGGNDSSFVIYNTSTDTSGNASINLLTRIWKSPNGVQNSDVRVNADGTSDILVFNYQYDTIRTSVTVTGTGDNTSQIALTPDTNVTLSEAAAQVLGANTITISTNEALSTGTISVDNDTTLDDVYDYWKWWSTRPSDVETTVSPIIQGSTFDAGGFVLEIDNGATLSKGARFTAVNGTVNANGVLDTDVNGGTVDFGTTGTFGADNTYTGGITIGARANPFLFTNTTFESSLRVTNSGGTVAVQPQGTTDFNTTFAGSSVEQRFIAAGYMVNNADVLLTTPNAGKVVFIRVSDNAVVSTLTVTAGQEITVNAQEPGVPTFNYNAYYRPTNSAGDDYVMTSILNINNATLPTTFQVTEYPAVLTSSDPYTNIVLELSHTVTAGGVASFVTRPTETGSPTVTFNQTRAKRFFFDIMNTDEYLESNGILFSNGTLTRETLVPTTTGFEVNTTYVRLSQVGTNQQVINIPDVTIIGNDPTISDALSANVTGTGTIQVRLFTTEAPTAGITEGQVQNALGVELEIQDVATRRNQEKIITDLVDVALGIPTDGVTPNPSSN